MANTFEKLMNGANGGLALLQVLAENSFDSVLMHRRKAKSSMLTSPSKS